MKQTKRKKSYFTHINGKRYNNKKKEDKIYC